MNPTRSTSIRDACLIIAVLAALLAAMRSGGLVASGVVFGVFLLFTLRCLVAVIGEPADRPLALGFVIPCGLYGLLLYATGPSEFETTRTSVLFSSQVLASIFSLLENRWTKASGFELMALGHTVVGLLCGYLGTVFVSLLRAQQGKPKCDE